MLRVLLLICGAFTVHSSPNQFPDYFMFGVASAAYQVEGAWNISGKAPSIWDHITHTRPEIVQDNSNGDIACDSYHKIEEDVAILKDLGVQTYRFSISWPRILPTPLTSNINQAGIDHYNRVINLLLKNGIEPLVTIFHWDLPQSLQEIGGFTNTIIVDAFVNYARVVFENFGDRVKYWTTFNEPNFYCLYGHGLILLAPALNQSGIAEYLCGHNILLAHGRAYHLYDREFRRRQNGKLSINFDTPWGEPASASPQDRRAADRFLQFFMGWFANPIFIGDYPVVMKNEIETRSRAEGYLQSRLPQFSQDEIALIRNSYDYLALNYYATYLIQDKVSDPVGEPSYFKDMNVNYFSDPKWPNTTNPDMNVVPWGLTKLLRWIKYNYNNPEIIITENGYPDDGEIQDVERVKALKLYMEAALEAMRKYDVNLKGYTVWGFLDDFEWESGYSMKFGIYHVDFTDPARPRLPKASARYYKNVIATRIP